MGTYVNRLQKTFGKTPVVFSTQAQLLEAEKSRKVLIGFGITLALVGGIYIGYQVRKKWWAKKETKDGAVGTEKIKTLIKPFLKQKPNPENYSNFSGALKLSVREKRERKKILYFKNRKNI